MSIAVNDRPRPHPPAMLHDCDCLRSEYGSGRITITTRGGAVTLAPPPAEATGTGSGGPGPA